LPIANPHLTPSAAKAGVTGKRCRFGGVMRQGCVQPMVIETFPVCG